MRMKYIVVYVENSKFVLNRFRIDTSTILKLIIDIIVDTIDNIIIDIDNNK